MNAKHSSQGQAHSKKYKTYSYYYDLTIIVDYKVTETLKGEVSWCLQLICKWFQERKKCSVLFCYLIPWVHHISWCTWDLTVRWLPSVSMCLLYSPRHTLSSPALQTYDSILQLSILFWWDFCFDNWFSFWLVVNPFSWFCQFLNFLNLKCNLSMYICGKIGNSIYPET